MPLPWDDENVLPNLRVIASLRVDDKLSVLKRGANPGMPAFTNIGKGGRSLRAIFARQKGGFWFKKHQRKERAKKGEDILNDLQYFIPLTSIFRRAKELWLASQQDIELLHIRNAYGGLANLQKTYMDEEDEARFQKMIFINQAIASLIPKEYDRYNCIIVQEGTQVLNLFNYAKVFPNLERTLLEYLNLTGNAYAGNEQGLGVPPGQNALTVTQLDITNVIGAVPEMFRHTAATTLPTLNAPYTRQGMGICQQFTTDWLRGQPLVDGTPMARNWNALKDLFIRLGGDEGMLFLVSQLACQAGLEALPQSLLTYRSQQAQNTMQPDWVLFYQGKFWTPGAVARTLSINTQLSIIEMKLVMEFNTIFFQAETKEDQPNWSVDPEVEAPLTAKITIIVKLERKGNRIDMKFSKVELEAFGK
jgi:hypothetical protein